MIEIKNLVNLCFEKNITPLLWGQHGIGKSQLVKQIAKEEKLELVELRLGQLEPMDLLGLPEKKNDKTIWLKPSWFPTEGKGILFLDEINRGHPDIMQSIFQLILDRELHTHALPDGWKIICAANFNTSNYSVNEMDDALMDRFFHIVMEFSIEGWSDWASQNGIEENLINIMNKRKIIERTDTALKLTTTPRSIEMLSMLIQSAQESQYFDICKGLLNQKDVSVFMTELGITSFKYNILKSFNKTQEKEIKKMVKSKKLDEIFEINKNLLEELKTSNYLEQPQRVKITKYLAILPKEVGIGFLKKFMNNPLFDENIKTAEFTKLRTKWAGK